MKTIFFDPLKRTSIIWVGSIGALLLIGISLVATHRESVTTTADVTGDRSSQSKPPAPSVSSVPPLSAARAGNPLELTKAQQVDRLSQSPSPVDAFAAYNILRACVWARRLEAEVFEGSPYKAPDVPSSVVCGDLTPGQIVSRQQLLDRAARAGVHGAFFAAGMEGSGGAGGTTGYEDTSSAAYTEWSQLLLVYREAGVKTGDVLALQAMSTAYENDEPRDLPKSLAYWVAATEVSGKPTPNIVARLSHLMTPEQAAAAIADGKKIATAARPVEGDQQ